MSHPIEIDYGEFWLLPGSDSRQLSVCMSCAAIVADTAQHTAFHNCRCTPQFTTKFDGRIHDPDTCPLAEDCGDWTWNPPCGGCDRCQLDMALHAERQNQSKGTT